MEEGEEEEEQQEEEEEEKEEAPSSSTHQQAYSSRHAHTPLFYREFCHQKMQIFWKVFSRAYCTRESVSNGDLVISW